MTFNDLISFANVEGAVRVSSCDNEGNETVHFEGDVWDDLGNVETEEEWGELAVNNIFAIDSVLHIEIEGE